MTDLAQMTMQQFIALVENNPDKHFDFNADGLVFEDTPRRLHSWSQAHIAYVLRLYYDTSGFTECQVLIGCAHDLDGWPCRPDVSVDSEGDEEIPITAPLLAVEIKSDSNSFKDLRAKARQYLAHGTAMVWLIYPERRFIEVYQAESDDQVLFEGDTLDGGAVLPGFQVKVAELLYPEQA